MNAEKTKIATMSVINVLIQHGLLDATSHMKDCGYTQENPVCNCGKLGADLYFALALV